MNVSWYSNRTTPKRIVSMRPIGGGRFVPVLVKVSPSLSNFGEIARTAIVKYLDGAYDIDTYQSVIKLLDGYYDLITFTSVNKFLDGEYDLNTFSPVIKYLDGTSDLNTFSPVTKYLDAAFDLNTFEPVTKYLDAYSDINTFTQIVKYSDSYYDITAFKDVSKYLDGAYDLNTYEEITRKLDGSYDISAFAQVVKYLDSNYDLNAFTSISRYLDAQYDLTAYAEVTQFLDVTYDLNAYQSIKKFVDGFYDLLANELFFGYAINTETGALTKYENFNFNSLSPRFGAKDDGIYSLSGTDDNGTVINWLVKTGKLDFQSPKEKRMTDAYVNMDSSGATVLTVTADSGTTAYPGKATTGTVNRKFDLALGHKGRFWSVQLANKAATTAEGNINEIELIVNETTRRI